VRKQPAINGVLALGIGVVLAFGALPGTAAAGPFDDALVAVKQDVEQGRCEQAAARLRDIDGLGNRAGLLAGQCQIQAGLYLEALTNLDRVRGARDLSSQQVGDVDLYRGVALYHLERFAEAVAALDSARGLTGEEAQLQLYTGLLLLREGDNDRAAPALESASRLEPRLTEPVASYYAGLAWQGAAERQRARDAFQRVVDLDGDGPWGKEAEKLLDSTELFPYFMRGRVGIEYDDNVLLRGSVTETGAATLDTAGQRDWRGVWEIDGGVQLWQSDDGFTSAGVTAGYSGNAHTDLVGLNTHFLRAGGYLARRLGPQTVAQARYQYGHAFVLNNDDYLQEHYGELSITRSWQKAGTTTLLASVVSDDLRFRNFAVLDGIGTPGNAPCGGAAAPCSPPGIDERNARDRDGLGYGAAMEHRYLVPVPQALDQVLEQIELDGSYRFLFYDSEGSEWEHFSHRFAAQAVLELPLDVSVRTAASYEHRDFDNPSTFPDAEAADTEYGLSSSDRNEHEFVIEGEIEKDITENWSVSALYQFLTNDSNRDAYNYDRHIVGGYINFRFD